MEDKKLHLYRMVVEQLLSAGFETFLLTDYRGRAHFRGLGIVTTARSFDVGYYFALCCVEEDYWPFERPTKNDQFGKYQKVYYDG